MMFDETVAIIEAAGDTLKRDDKNRYEPVIVTTSNGEYKLLPVQTLLLAQNEIQKSMLDLISEANEFKKDVFRIVAHDLRNPLSVVIGFANLINNRPFETEQAKFYADQIYLAAKNMDNLINDFLVAAINDATDFDLHYSVFNVSAYVKTIAANFENQLMDKQQELIFQPLDNNATINADRSKIAEVLENLISNAIKYSGFGKRIIVNVLMENELVIIKVIDEGPGFSENDKVNLFKKFQKLSAKPTANEPSTGLGLYIVKRIIDKHNGKIWVESELDKGSTFFVSLPLHFGDIINENTKESLSN